MFDENFTKRSLVIGGLLSMLVAMSAVYLALRQNAFYWASVLTSLVSIGVLRLLSRVPKRASVHEINITQAAASTGGILAAGLCFVVPALYFMDKSRFQAFISDTTGFILTITTLSLVGGICGVIFSAYLRRHMIEEEKLAFPTGIAAADTIKATEKGGKQMRNLMLTFFGVALFTVLRDGIQFGKVSLKSIIPYFQDFTRPPFTIQWGYVPAFIGAGYLMGWRVVFTWGLGALFSNFLYVPALYYLLKIPFEAKQPYVLSMGVGIVVGGALTLFVTKIGPSIVKTIRAAVTLREGKKELNPRWVPIVGVLSALFVSAYFHISLVASVLMVVGAWLMSSLAARMSGEVNVDPMEIFAVIVLIAIRIFVPLSTQELIYLGTIICVAVGVAGDTLFDLKAGHILGTTPIDITKAQLVGAISASFITGISMLALFKSFTLGTPELFALQAQSVAYMLGAINWTIFGAGIVIGIGLTFFKQSGIAFGVGVFIPLFLTVPFIVGGIWSFLKRKRGDDETERIISAGAIGGEGFVGAILAIIREWGHIL